MILVNVCVLVIGFIALIKGADWFVDGSSALAKNFKVPEVVIGLTIVALGTSAPELAVSISAALQGANEIALSNVVGSNIFNLLCVLGVCAVINAIPVDEGILKRDVPLSIAVTILVLLISCLKTIFSGGFRLKTMDEIIGNIGRISGMLLILIFMVYIIYLIFDAKKNMSKKEETKYIWPLWKCILLIIIGLLFVICGGQAVVCSSKELAQSMGMSETLIGLTIVAIGTSLPELVTSIVAARKGETELAVGNVIGSNIFNLLFILGISSVISPIAVNAASVYDLIILVVVSVITYLFSMKQKAIKRSRGMIMIFIYLVVLLFATFR